MKHSRRTLLATMALTALTPLVTHAGFFSDPDRDGIDNVWDQDMDGDGLPNEFEQDNGFSQRYRYDGGWDADGDGWSNAEEYRANTDLTDPSSSPDTMTGYPQQKLFTPLGTLDQAFGTAVAIEGSTLIASTLTGTYYPGGGGSGNVHVFGMEDGLWQAQALLLPSTNEGSQWFGAALDLEGDTLIVGAPRENVSAEVTGAAYIFSRDVQGWELQAKLTHADAQAYDQMGYEVLLAGDQALVGCPYCADDDGRVFVFERSGSDWTLADTLANCPAGDGCNFGMGLSVDGDTAVIGAPYLSSSVSTGVSYVYQRVNNNWQPAAQISSSQAAEPRYFGTRSVIDGDTLLIADFAPNGFGSSYVSEFVFSNGVWTEQALFTPEAYDFSTLGRAIDLAGDKAVLSGALPGGGENAVLELGRSNGQWTETSRTTGAYSDEFGYAVALDADGSQMVIGLTADDDASNGAGTVIVQDLSAVE